MKQGDTMFAPAITEEGEILVTPGVWAGELVLVSGRFE